MPRALIVRMTIPIPAQPIVGVPAMIFHRWLPIHDKDFLTIEENDLRLDFWFDVDSTAWGVPILEHELDRHINVPAHRVNADMRINDLSDELVAYITSSCKSPAPLTSPLLSKSQELEKRVGAFVMTYVNRLISFVRTEKGQYWLSEYQVDPRCIASVLPSFGAMVNVGEGEWCRWRPMNGPVVVVGGIADEGYTRYIHRPDWTSAKAFVLSTRRTSLVRELLARGEEYAGSGHRRAALIESVSALEVAISQFVRQPKATEAFGPILAQRMGCESLANQKEALGLRGTVRYLFAVIFTEEALPSALLLTCQQAIDERNNVVHNGQRDVSETKIFSFLAAVRQLCDLLDKYSDF